MSRRSSRRWALRILALLTVLVAAEDVAAAPVKSRVVLIAPFDASGLDTDDRWVGAAVAEALTLGLVQHQAFIPVEHGRLRAVGIPEVWTAELVQQAARTARADVALWRGPLGGVHLGRQGEVECALATLARLQQVLGAAHQMDAAQRQPERHDRERGAA